MLNELEVPASELVVLSSDQAKLGFDLDVAKNGRYVLVINYFTPGGDREVRLRVKSESEKGK